MSGVAIVRALLAGNGALTALVPATQILSGVVPEATPLPAIGVMEIGATEQPHINSGGGTTTIVDCRVEVTVLAANYPLVKQIHALARKACNYQRGSIAGLTVILVRRIANGPDMSDLVAKISIQSLDFSVLYHELN